MKRHTTAVLLLIGLAGGPVLAQQGQEHAAHHPATGTEASAKAASLTEGEVRKVDKEARKITIRHGAIANLDMPPMTMVFQVSDVSFLDRVKSGDKIRFVAEKREGAFTVTRIESAS